MRSVGKIGFIGGGNMAEALVKGLLKGTFPAKDIVVSELSDARRQVLRERYGVGVTFDNRDLVETCSVVVLAVKPQNLAEALDDCAGEFNGDKLLISVLAGVSTEKLAGFFENPPRVVRTMPNTPALVGEGATGLSPGRTATADDLMTARHLFETVGTVQVVREVQLDAVTGLSGSGPAYVFTIIEALADGGVQQGLARDVAQSLAVQTVLGAARLVQESGEHPASLRDKVCSPGGTAISAVKVLEEKGLRSTLMEAVARAAERSRELGANK